MNILSLEAVDKKFGSGQVLKGVAFGLEHDERVGIIGRNGSGKTTLLRIIAGRETPDAGRVVLGTGRRVAYVPQNPDFEIEQTVLEAVFSQGSAGLRRLAEYETACLELEAAGGTDESLLTRVADLSHEMDIHGSWGAEADAKAILHQLGLGGLNAQLSTLSGGQRKRLALARALIEKPDLLILDEPTNHLDVETIGWLEDYLAVYSGALLLVTHDRYFLDRVVGQMLEIEDGRVQRYAGNYSTYLEKKEEQAGLEEAGARKHDGMVRRELAWLRRGARARSTKQKSHVQRVEALLQETRKRAPGSLELAAPSARLGNKILNLNHAAKTYGEKKLFTDFSMSLTGKDRIGFIGPNGSGKTTMLEILAGRLTPDQGTLEVGETVVIGYYDQESEALEEELRVFDYIRQAAEHIRTPDGNLISATQMLERFLFTPTQQFTPIGRLSGGERRRLYLLRLLMGAPNVLLLDEPTNDFDIATLVALETYLESFSGCLIVASHDRAFLDRCVRQVYHFEGNGRVRGYPGNYTTFLEMRPPSMPPEEAGSTRNTALSGATGKGSTRNTSLSGATGKGDAPIPPGTSSRTSTHPRKLSFKERQELTDLERRIHEAETRKAEIESSLAEPSGDYGNTTSLSAELQSLNDRLDHDMERWAELAEKAG